MTLAAVTLLASSVAGQERPDTSRLLYHGYDYGSDAYFSPLSVLLNKGYDIFQLRNHERDFWGFPYGNAWDNGIIDVFQNPGAAVERFGGWGRFIRVEVLPLTTSVSEMNWIVNYTEHFVGGGLTMRGLDEWYGDRGVPLPMLWAAVTTYGASVLNEISEQPDVQRGSAAGVADLLIFDVAALLFFQWDTPVRFFAHTLQAADWSNMASLTFPNGQLQNNGQYFTMKIPVGFDRTRVFLRGGMGVQIGVTRRLDAQHSFSLGIGADTQVQDVDKVTGHETVEFAMGAGIYYDRNNSLMWSLTVSPAENLFAVNLYPGLVPGVGRDVGFWAVYTRDGNLLAGISLRKVLGLGLGLGW
jgi:hypothetical protein